VALRERDPAALAVLFDRHSGQVQRVLARVVGVDSELPDLLQEVFARALSGAASLGDGAAIGDWLTGIAVSVARRCLRRRRRTRWLRFLSPADLSATGARTDGAETDEVVRCTYQVLDRMPPEERIAFALRFLDQMELTEVAAACHASPATIRRRVARAERRFSAAARAQSALRSWLT
jgi:RNA polymerase sigma-70 factor (ECF subfamily)